MSKAKYDRANEQVIIASVLKDKASCERTLTCATAKDFQGARHRVIMSAVEKCSARSLSPDNNNIAVHAEGAEFGKLAYLNVLRKKFDVAENLDHNLDILRRDAARVRASKAAEEFQESVLDREIEFSDCVLDAGKILYGLKDAPLNIVSADYSIEWSKRFDARCRGEITLFVSTGYEALNGVLNEGYAAGSMTTIAGRPRMGKTTMIADQVKRLLRTTELNILVGAIEKGKEYFTNLLIASVTGIDKRLIIKEPGKLTEVQIGKIKAAVKWLFKDGRLTIVDNPVRELVRAGKWSNESAMDKVGELLSHGNYHVAFWDIWQRMLKHKYPENIDSALDSMYEVGKATATHNVIIQQIHRRAEDRSKDKARRPTLIDLKQSGAYEEYSDLVLLIHREKVFKKFTPRGDMMEITIAKQKLGDDGITIVARFKPQFCRLKNPRIATAEDTRPGVRFADSE